MEKEFKPMTVRVPQYIIDYRNEVHTRTPRLKKKHFDTEVYDFYIEHHPLPASDNEKEVSP